MLGNLAEALLTLGMMLTVVGVLALTVLLVRLLARSSVGGAKSDGGDPAPLGQAPPVVYVVFNIVAGAAGAFVSLEAYYYGIALTVAAGALLFRQARRHRWFALGGFLLGMGLCAAGFLSAALTNRDPAVTYDPSTIPTFWASAVVALGGAVTLLIATTAPARHHSV
jgi:hypothetical protein